MCPNMYGMEFKLGQVVNKYVISDSGYILFNTLFNTLTSVQDETFLHKMIIKLYSVLDY